MKVSGFTFVRNAILYDYPIIEAIHSILPLCDEVVVAVGDSMDGTLQMIQSIDSDKIKILETKWDETLREGGRVLAVETDKAFAAIDIESDWAIYIQGDEVLHEKYLPIVHDAMKKNLNNYEVDGLLFNYKHFYGSYDYVGTSSVWYAHEIRVVRNNKNIFSYRDAQGFRKQRVGKRIGNGEKLNVKSIEAFIYHYGWVKEPKAMQEKQKTFQKLWHSDEDAVRRAGMAEQYEYEKNIQQLAKFEDTHPSVMLARIKKRNWAFEDNNPGHRLVYKEFFKQFCKKYLRLDFNYRNYNLLK